MAGTGLISVEEALARLRASVPTPLPPEQVPLEAAYGRVLAEDLAALRTQPPFPASAMDGYAVRGSDVAEPNAILTLIGTSAAGNRYTGKVGPGETVRIFTGAPVPEGTDTVVMQENTRQENTDSPHGVGARVRFLQSETIGRSVRTAGMDFRTGDVLLRRGQRISARGLALAAAMNHASIPVHARPAVALISTGDELVHPGQPIGPDQIVASNAFAVAAQAQEAGAKVVGFSIVKDDRDDLARAIRAAMDAQADVIVTLGGASVGDHDLVRPVLADMGLVLDFWRIAMRPGKPLMFGRLGQTLVLGLPGNPVSAVLCAEIFLKPLLEALTGQTVSDHTSEAILSEPLKANDLRQDYLRARIVGEREGLPLVAPFLLQDSALVSVLAQADVLILRAPHAAATLPGERCRILRLPA